MKIRFPRLSAVSAALGAAVLAMPAVAAPPKPAHHPAPPKIVHHPAPGAPVVRMVTTKGTILIKLYPKDAPLTVANFEKLVKKGFYNGLTFHRVGNAEDLTAPPGIAQGGDPAGNGSGGPGYMIKGEFKANGVNNPLTHVVGAVAMARAGDPNSAGSQFYICSKPVHDLDGSYAVFGQVIKGLDVASRLKVGDKMTKVTMAK